MKKTAIKIFEGNMACNTYGEFFKGHEVEAEKVDEDQ